ncbi:MAG: M48 family metalloprotease, partial [Betaproteobacteria bacterium]|nr:M48 family metalloprotease [Betaproteobacteria bacterium]
MIRSPRALFGRPRLMRPLALLLSASLAFTPPVLADGLPDLGDAAQSELSPQMEKQVGESIINEIRLRDPQYLDDPEITAYLEQIGGRLATASPDPSFGFNFFAMADPTINAFATFGGYVGVNTGLLMAAQTESELAGVLAHEISHVTQHHLARGMAKDKQQSTVAMIAMALALLAARNSPNGASAAIMGSQAAMVQSQLAFSRDFEREADRIGFQTLQKAGFDVRGMGDFFQRLQQATRLYENNAPAYMRT